MITLISVNAIQTFNLLVPGATSNSCSLFRNCVTSSAYILVPNPKHNIDDDPPHSNERFLFHLLTLFHFPFHLSEIRSIALRSNRRIQRKKKRINGRHVIFHHCIKRRGRDGSRLSHPSRLEIDDITIPSRLVAPRGGYRRDSF